MDDEPLRFSVYGMFELTVRPGADGWWVAERVRGEGKRQHLPDVVIPPGTSPDRVVDYLEAVLHESARPETTIEHIR